MEPCYHRFTAAEGGARLAATASVQNTLVTECGDFISTRLLHEEAYNVRGLLSNNKQRSIRITLPENVKPDAYELRILTDLKVMEAVDSDDVEDWSVELEVKEVLVCTSQVIRFILEEGILKMTQINVLVVDSCHLIYKDEHLQYIMKIYKNTDESLRPRILAITYPLFSSTKTDKDPTIDKSETIDSRGRKDSETGENKVTDDKCIEKGNIDKKSVEKQDIDKIPIEKSTIEEKSIENSRTVEKSVENLSIDKTSVENTTIENTAPIADHESKENSSKDKKVIEKITISNKPIVKSTIDDPDKSLTIENINEPIIVQECIAKLSIENESNENSIKKSIDGIDKIYEKYLKNTIVEKDNVDYSIQLATIHKSMEKLTLNEKSEENVIGSKLDNSTVDGNIIDSKLDNSTVDGNIIDSKLDISASVQNITNSKADNSATDKNIDSKLDNSASVESIIDSKADNSATDKNILNSKLENSASVDNIVDLKADNSATDKNIIGSKLDISASVENIIDSNADSSSIDNNILDQSTDDKIEKCIDSETGSEIIVKKKPRDYFNELSVYENHDDFNMYEKLEWKIDHLENELCCKMDLAEDIDGCKRLAAPVAKPKELIIEYSDRPPNEELIPEYVELETFMRDNVFDALDFLNDHRHDPTEIYGEELYEELKNIPDPTLEPKQLFKEFLYVLDELGPYAADKAAFSLLIKLEKLKIKVPYERHFLLLRLCTTVFVKIRCNADLIFSKFDTDWDKIRLFSTPKLLRLVEILEKFTPDNVSKPDNLISDSDNKVSKPDNQVSDPDNKVPGPDNKVSDSHNKVSKSDSKLNKDKLLNDIDNCDFSSLGDKIEDKLNIIQANLKELNIEASTNLPKENKESKEAGNVRPRTRRGRSVRPRPAPHNPHALCAILFLRHAYIAKILFIVVADLTRVLPSLSYITCQYCADEPTSEQKESQKQGKRHEEVLKKFRMHECNLLLTTSALEEGIDLPRCNLVLRWDIPPSYRSYVLSRSRGRAARAGAALLCKGTGPHTDVMLHNLATYTELDQIISRKCGCGIQDEPTPEEESIADTYNSIIKPYTPEITCTCQKQVKNKENETKNKENETKISFIDKIFDANEKEIKGSIDVSFDANKEEINIPNSNIETSISNIETSKSNEESTNLKEVITPDSNYEFNTDDLNSQISNLELDSKNSLNLECQNDIDIDSKKCCCKKNEENVASVDLNSAIALINRYCAKLPSDTFTRLAPQWWMENVRLNGQDAFICTLRLPLNCPVKYNIVGHPMPTRVLARRMVALQACRILHKSGELDNQLMPIGKENFKAAELENTNVFNNNDKTDLDDAARPGTTKRRQYYYKRTAAAFTNCQPIIDTSDLEIDPPEGYKKEIEDGESKGESEKEIQCEREKKKEDDNSNRRNRLYLISCSLWCGLPERYNTRGRRLHTPQHADTALAILMYTEQDDRLQIPAFPVYTRSGEVRVRVCRAPDADVRLSPRRARLIRRFMRFVFDEVLRVRRRGMKLQSEGSTKNNYYVVPTIKSTNPDGSTKIDVDWSFLELIYQHTEEKKLSELEKPLLWYQDEEESFVQQKGDDLKQDEDGMMKNPLLRPDEVFIFDAEKYKEAVVTPWYRNRDQPQFFLVAEICRQLSPASAFPSELHASFSEYYLHKYRVKITQPDQPLLDVDHTSARLNLLTPRYVNRKGVALPVSSERTRRNKRDRLDQKQILVPELCRRHPFAAPLWFATVALPCVLYRINALLIADEIRRAVANQVGVGIAKLNENFEWPPLDFGWSLSEVLSADAEKNEKKREEMELKEKELKEKEEIESITTNEIEEIETEEPKEKTINDILQEKEDAENTFEIGTWTNDMASSIPESVEYDEMMEPLPSNLTFCTSASGGVNWCDPVQKPKQEYNNRNYGRTFSMADSDCSFMSSDFDTDDSDFDSDESDDDVDGSRFCNNKNSNAAVGVRIEYKTPHEAEAVDLQCSKPHHPAPARDAAATMRDRAHMRAILATDTAMPTHYIKRFKNSVARHKTNIISNNQLIKSNQPITDMLPPIKTTDKKPTLPIEKYTEIFPYTTEKIQIIDGQITLESIEKNKRFLLKELMNLNKYQIKKLSCFSMKDVDIDSPDYVNEKLINVGFDNKKKYEEKIRNFKGRKYEPYFKEKNRNGTFDFDYQPDLEGHPGPSPSVILQALTMSNANDGINLERLETIGDSFLKFAITAYLYCAHPTVHEGKLSHMRSKQVSNLNLYRLGRRVRLGSRMIASKFEPHDNWLPPCHKPPPDPHKSDTKDGVKNQESQRDATGCYIPYNLITQHSIPDKSIADCVEALIGAYLVECGCRGALLFMSWLGIPVLPTHSVVVTEPAAEQKKSPHKQSKRRSSTCSSSTTDWSDDSYSETSGKQDYVGPVGARPPCKDEHGNWIQIVYGELKAPPSPLLRYIEDPEGELERMLSGYEELERTLQYRFNDRSLLLQALTHASHQRNTLTDCYQRLEFLGDAILDYLITRHLFEDRRRHSPGALTDLRSALVNNTIFATLAVRHGFHKYFRHMSPGLNEVLTKYVKIQEENGHSISEEHYLIQEDELEQAEDVEVPKALGDLFESVAGAIFLDSGMSLGAVWQSYVRLMGAELEAFSAAAPKSPVRELLEAEPDTAKFGKPERLADGRRVRVCVEVFGRGTFKGIGRNYRIAKGTAARCALRHLKIHRR